MRQFETFTNLKLLIISGSTQAQGQSLKVARYMEAYLKTQAVKVSVLDLHQLELPFFGHHQKQAAWSKRWSKISAKLKAADGLVLVSPEYNGGPSPAILNLMLYVDTELRHKPVLLTGVSAGRGGAYPIAALRQNGPKDPQYVVLSDNLIISQVYDVLNDCDFEASNLTPADKAVRLAVVDKLWLLLNYARVLRKMELDTEN